MTLRVRNRLPGLVRTEGHAGWMAWGGVREERSRGQDWEGGTVWEGWNGRLGWDLEGGAVLGGEFCLGRAEWLGD